MYTKIIFVIALSVLGAVALAEAQKPTKIPRIGYLTGAPLPVARIEAFRQGLRERGYVEGKNILVEWRSWEGKLDRQQPLATELVSLKLDVIVTVGPGDARAAKEATTTIPIVMITAGDPVGSGLVASLARPGGNVTGLSNLTPELSGKRLELLKEIVSGLLRVAVFASSASGDYAQAVKELDTAAGPLGVKLQHLNILTPRDFETAFQEATKERAEAVIVRVPSSFISSQRPQIAAFAVKSRLPVMHERLEEVEAGGLMSYGVNTNDLYRRAAIYVDKILKGAKPAELPVEQPTRNLT